MNTFTFNGINSQYFNLFIERYPNEAGGEKIINSVNIAGRTGALTIDTGAYANTSKSYEVMFRSECSPQKMRDIRQWLAMSEGYCRLEDTYDADIYRRARVVKTTDFVNHINRYGKGTITFDCDPRRFLKEGEREISGAIQNDWMPSKPVVIITATGAGVVNVGDYTIQVTSNPNQVIYVDSELMEVHNGSTNLSSYVNLSEFPILKNGLNQVSYTGNITSVLVKPNFWQP